LLTPLQQHLHHKYECSCKCRSRHYFISFISNSETAFYVGSLPYFTTLGVESKNKTEIQQQRCSWLKGYLDNIRLIAKRKLGCDDNFIFNKINRLLVLALYHMSISNAINIAQVWDVTDIFQCIQGGSGQAALNFKAKTWENSDIFALDPIIITTKFPNQRYKSKARNACLKRTRPIQISIIRSLHLLF
jgi:hypothetical protein